MHLEAGDRRQNRSFGRIKLFAHLNKLDLTEAREDTVTLIENCVQENKTQNN